MRTPEEIITYYQSIESDDFFGYAADVLLTHLPANLVKPYLREGVDPNKWKSLPLERDAVVEEMRNYMEFAWEKVENHRGLSAMRSVEKMQSWLWLLSDDETLAYAKDEENHYAQYGAPILKKICEVYGFPIPKGSDIANMAQGKPCSFGCAMGCGKGPETYNT